MLTIAQWKSFAWLTLVLLQFRTDGSRIIWTSFHDIILICVVQQRFSFPQLSIILDLFLRPNISTKRQQFLLWPSTTRDFLTYLDLLLEILFRKLLSRDRTFLYRQKYVSENQSFRNLRWYTIKICYFGNLVSETKFPKLRRRIVDLRYNSCWHRLRGSCSEFMYQLSNVSHGL